jgi:hypothetical protein
MAAKGGALVPQIWLTYNELAALMDCSTAAARAVAVAFPLDRRRSRDARTRVKLNAALTEIFLDRMSRERIDRGAVDSDATMHVGMLRTMHAQMAGGSLKALPAPAPRQSRA